MGNTPKITRITIDNVKYDIDLPSDASPVIDSLEVRQIQLLKARVQELETKIEQLIKNKE